MSIPHNYKRAIHWVFKVGNLKRAVEFYEKVFTMKVLRHEEFTSGCEATCNGPYQGAWSKTMIGYGPEKENFALELTYNYGIDEYNFGNDLQYIVLRANKSCISIAESLGFVIDTSSAYPIIIGPDKYKFKVLPLLSNRKEAFEVISIRSNNLKESVNYYKNILGMTIFDNVQGISDISEQNTIVGYNSDQVRLQLIRPKDGDSVNHALSFGRIAFATKSGVQEIYDHVLKHKETILTPPLSLPTPGKTDVVVTILADPDGYEICFVGEEGFYQLAEPTYDKINWQNRANRGADGHKLPRLALLEHSKKIEHIKGNDDYEKALKSSGDGLVVVDFYASWCSRCKALMPAVVKLAEENQSVRFFTVDIDDDQDFSSNLGISKVPNFFFIHKGKKIAEYIGSDVNALTSKFKSLI